MRDAKMTFYYPASATAGSTLMGLTGVGNTIVANTITYYQGATLTQTGATAAGATATTGLEFNYGGLLTNGVSGSVMDNDQSGAVDAADYVRGQILNPLYVASAISTVGLPATDTLTCEVHASNTLGFTPSASTVVATNAYIPPVAFTIAASVVSAAGATISLNTPYFITAIAGGVITLSGSRGGTAVANITSVTPTSTTALAVNQSVTFNVAISGAATTAVVLSVCNDVNSAIITVPIQSYGKFLRVRWVATTNRNPVTINVTRTSIQTGRESSY